MKTLPSFRLHRRGFTLIELMVVISILAVLASVAYGPIIDQINRGARIQALENMRQVAKYGMRSFLDDVQAYPNDDTAEILTDRYQDLDYGALTGPYSNCYMRQLLISGALSKEQNFYAAVTGAKTPDERVANGQALTRGECGFSYVMKEDGRSISPNDTSNPPILMASVLEESTGANIIFDGECFREHGIIVRTDGSAEMKKLSSEGNVFVWKELFKEDRRGNPTAENYKVLPPEL